MLINLEEKKVRVREQNITSYKNVLYDEPRILKADTNGM